MVVVLAGAVGTEQSVNCAARYGEADAVHGAGIAVALLQVGGFDGEHGGVQ